MCVNCIGEVSVKCEKKQGARRVCEVYVARVEDWSSAERFLKIVKCDGDC